MKADTVTKLSNIRQRVDADRVQRIQYAPTDFERDVVALLDAEYPFSILPNVRLFGARERNSSDHGHEIDAILHIKKDAVDYLVLIETKKQSLRVDKDEWWASYKDGPKAVRGQLNNHTKIVREYLRPLARHTDLRMVSIVVSSDPLTRHIQKEGDLNTPQHLCSFQELPSIMERIITGGDVVRNSLGRVLRVEQSLFLNTLRIGLPETHLGHPELANAVRYVERCRRALDEALFQQFTPTPDRWLIVGTAGMGKSVLLAYTAAVLTSSHRLDVALGDTFTRKDTELFAKIGYNADPKRGSVALMAMSEKQLQSLRTWYGFFQDRLREGDHSGGVTFRPPVFVVCRDEESFKRSSLWSALLIDEAHDLRPWAPTIISQLNGEGTYIVAAFDPHQRIRQNQLSTRYIPGLNFSNKAVRLRQIYRNPAPIYIASLALMFRWFSKEGPKIVPSPNEFQDMFGFKANPVPGGQGMKVIMESDAHPANSWCHTVAQLPDAATAFSILSNERMGCREVLWVRFSEEDADFDYETLARHFTYHNCRIEGADELSNKYIKGQDYAIVVIEGFPSFMDDYADSADRNAEDAEKRMWQFRRELYLCASRATCFLYFICKVPESEPISRIRMELDAMISATSVPEDRHTGGTRTWSFQIPKAEISRTLATLEELETPPANGAEEVVRENPAPPAPSPSVSAQSAPTAMARPAPPPPPKLPSSPVISSRLTTTSTTSPRPASTPITPASPASAPVIPSMPERPSIPSSAQATAQPKTPFPPLLPEAKLPLIQLRGEITPRNLATALGKRSALEVILSLRKLGEQANHDSVISRELAAIICKQEGYTLSDSSN